MVVDNNSSDDTAAIVAQLANAEPKIRLVRELKQGCAPARTAGMDVASGDVIARIDVDTAVDRGWAASIRRFFEEHGDAYGAATGTCSIYDLPFQKSFRKAHQKLNARKRNKLERGEGIDSPGVFGSNMAIARGVWADLKPLLHDGADIHEDTDITLSLKEKGYRIALLPGMSAQISGRRYLTSPAAYWSYAKRGPMAFAVHGHRVQAAVNLVLVAVFAMPFYFLTWMPFRAWNPETATFSFRRIFLPVEKRSQPRAHLE
ncbi:glycosyltransferase family 2 protein [Rhodococcus opacus]|uniref:glycosyltransferase n=1 Tax=Rhodococcus opacus TaxID=37919 RepID=UPI00226432E4|nr:glycosyltransferase family 2 protein [Rhodococcus opacus]MDX5963635.1 glycosyltransferase family 2 protein [Rhodococcus opacus]